MNKYQEALDRVLNHVNLKVVINDEHGLPKILRDNQGYQDLELIQELIDKETPMKPVKSFYGDYLCGKCNNLVWENFTPDRHERCNDKECGQVVDWTEE